MNALCYKIVFSKRLGTLVAVGEHTVGQGKTASGSGVRSVVNDAISSFIGALSAVFAAVALTFLTASFTASVGFAAGPAAKALPSGASVNSGSVAISNTSSANNATMTINQTTDKASVNWQSFNIGSAARVNVQQYSASSVLLNRVVGNDPSQIFGKLSANGQVILINPNGIVFGSGGSVTASAFTASAFGINEQDFASGKYKYTRTGSTAGVTVQDGATLNATAPGGYIALIGASVDNQGRISTQQGAVVLAAGESITLPAGLTNNISVPLSGKVRLELRPSTINAMVANSGTITTEGGQVLMQAAALSDAVASITHTGTIDTTGAQGGAVTVLADGGVIKATGSITANSSGNDEHGKQRKGGDIIIGRDEETSVLAKATDVNGATLESQGGFVETSGEYLATTGIRVQAKEWLLDPNDIVIGSAATTGGFTPTANGTSQILASDISTALTAGTNVTIATSASASGGNGDITVNSAISNTAAGNTLTLNAYRNITLNSNITVSNLALNAATGNISGAADLAVSGNTTLNSATTGTLSGVISGSGSVTKTGLGTQILTGANTYTGVTTISGGTLQIGNGGNTGTLGTGNVTLANGANLSYQRNVATTIANTISGSGNVTANITDGGLTVNTSINLTTGNITLTGTSTNSTGVYVQNSVTSAAGDINITGISNTGDGVYVGNSPTLSKITSNNGAINITGTSNQLRGVWVDGNATVQSTKTASTPITSVGVTIKGTSTGGVANNNVGAQIQGVVSAAGKLTITGETQNNGLFQGVQIANAVSGDTVEITGTSAKYNGVEITGSVTSTSATQGTIYGTGTNAFISGDIKLEGISTSGPGVAMTSNSATPAISAANNVIVKGTSNSAGVVFNGTTTATGKNVTIEGTSANGNGVFTNANIIATTGDISITGKSTGSSALSLRGVMTASQNVKIKGENTSSGNSTPAVFIDKAVTATAGTIDITAITAGPPTIAALLIDLGASLSTTNNAINLKADTLSLASGATINAGTGTVSIKTVSADAKINIGSGTGASGVDVGSTTTSLRTLGLSNAELNRITAANLVIGDANNTGGLKVSAATTTNTTTGNLTLQTSGGMSITGALTAGNTTLKDITLLAKSSSFGLTHQAKVKGDNITMRAESTATAGNILGYYGAGSGAQFEAAKSLDLTGITSSQGNGFYSIDGTYTAGTGIAIKGTSANGQGVGFDHNVNITNTTGDINITGTATNTSNNTATTGVHTEGIALRGSKITNNGGNTKLTAVNGNVLTAQGTWTGSIPNEIINSSTSNGIIQITAGNASASNSGGVDGTALTITQNGNGGVLVSSSGTGNVTAPKIVNAGSGDVVIAAGTQIAAGDGSGGQVKTVSGNTITQSSSGKNYLYTGNANDTGSLSTVGGFANGLFLSTIGTDTVNAASNTAYASGSTRNTITGGAKTQVMFREKVALTGALNNATLTYGDSTNSTAVKAALQTANTGASNVISTTSNAGTFKILNADLIADMATGKPSVDTALSLPTNKSTSGNLKVNSVGYNIDIAGTKYTLNTTAKLVVNKLALAGVTIDGAVKTYGDVVSAGLVKFTGSNLKSGDVVGGTASVVSTAADLSTSNNLKVNSYDQTVSALTSGNTNNDTDNYSFSAVTNTASYVVGKKTISTASIASVTDAIYGTAKATGLVALGADVVTGDLISASNTATVKDGVNSNSGNLRAGDYKQSVAGGLNSGNSKNDAENYDFAGVTTGATNYTVGQKSLTALYAANDKVFDGNTNATVVGSLQNTITGDLVNPTHTSATFDTFAVGTSKTVTVTGISLSGVDLANYKIDPVANPTFTATARAAITPSAPTPPAPVVPTNATNGRVKIPLSAANPFQLASAEELGGEDFCQNTSIDPLKGESSGNSNSSCTCEDSKVAQDAQICFEKNTQKISAQ